MSYPAFCSWRQISGVRASPWVCVYNASEMFLYNIPFSFPQNFCHKMEKPILFCCFFSDYKSKKHYRGKKNKINWKCIWRVNSELITNSDIQKNSIPCFSMTDLRFILSPLSTDRRQKWSRNENEPVTGILAFSCFNSSFQ